MSSKRRLYLMRLISALALVAWGCFIFGFSEQPGIESGGLSAQAAGALVELGDFVTGTSTTGTDFDAAVEALQFPIRKAAHMTEYAFLAVLALIQLRLWPLFNRRLALTSQACGQSTASSAQAYDQSVISPLQTCSQRPQHASNDDSDTRLRRSVGIAWCFAVLYAVTDEIHQLFVPDRTGLFTDVLIDATGAAIGLLLAVIIISVRRKRSNLRDEP